MAHSVAAWKGKDKDAKTKTQRQRRKDKGAKTKAQRPLRRKEQNEKARLGDIHFVAHIVGQRKLGRRAN